VKNSEVETCESDGASVLQARARRLARSGERRIGASDQAPPARGIARLLVNCRDNRLTSSQRFGATLWIVAGASAWGIDTIPTGGTQ
jgi:hypothetical protein